MSEPDPGTLDVDHALRDGRLERSQRRRAARLLQHDRRRRPQARGDQQGIAGTGRQRGQPDAHHPLQIGRHRQRFLRRRLGPRPLQRPGQLQAIERIPARRVEQPAVGEPGQPGTCGGPKGHLERLQGQRADPQARGVPGQVRCHPRNGLPTALGPDRRKQPGRLITEPPQREFQHPGAGVVEPLQVVDSKDHRPRLRQAAENRQESDTDCSLLRPAAYRIRQQQRDLQRPPLRRRQPGERPVKYPVQQISERRERQRRFRFGWPARQDCKGAPSGPGRTGAPHGALADPGGTL